jgi:hypothetical protein
MASPAERITNVPDAPNPGSVGTALLLPVARINLS